MISVEEALSIVAAAAIQPKTVTQSVDTSLCGMTLAADVRAPMALPPFSQSAMDGYAVHWHENPNYKVIGEVQAGSAATFVLEVGQAVRIFTGAKVPDTANAVVMQEKVKRTANTLQAMAPIRIGQSIRPKGGQLGQGDLVFSKGTLINPPALGLLLSLGIKSVPVCQQPSVAIVVTGDELVSPGQPLAAGQVYESNSCVLQAALQQLGCKSPQLFYAPDNRQATDIALTQALELDLVLISGGISVGDYDFVGDSLTGLGVETLFYKVRQKPGKPLFFGLKNQTPVFALPGNPASTLNCFYIYVVPLLHRLMGRSSLGLLRKNLKLTHSYENKLGRALFLKATAIDRHVTVIDEMNSASLQSFATANALVYIAAATRNCHEGAIVQTWMLPRP
ncbi:MAG: gephyrin-like molybdotransferase Glp [Flavobacteriaceae bacterium]